MFENTIQGLLFPLELFTGLLVYVLPLKKKKGFFSRMMLFAVAFLVLIIVLILSYIYRENIERLAVGINFFVPIGIFFYMVLIVLLFYKVCFQEAVYCVTCAYLTEHIAYSIRILANNVVGKSVAEPGNILYFLIHFGVYIVTYNLFTKRMVQEQHYTTSSINSISIMISTLFMVGVMSTLATIYDFEIIHSVYALFSCFFVLFSQFKQQKQLNLQEELYIQKQLWIKHKTQYEISRDNIDIINRKCHDLKHQVAAIRKISDTEKQKEAINSIEESVMIYDSIIETGNDILDTVLTEKGLICNRNHISMTCIADGKILEFMNAIDIYTLFGNVLDNAIEAVSKLENEEERFISLLVYEKVNLILIQVENPYFGMIRMENGIPITHKKDKSYHGFGIKSIIHTAEKYNGFATIENDNQVFMLRVTIPKENL